MKKILFAMLAFITLTGFRFVPCDRQLVLGYAFFGPPQIISYSPSDLKITADEGQCAVMEISYVPYDDPTLKVRFFHNGIEFDPALPKYGKIIDNGFVQLLINKLTLRDAGVYSIQLVSSTGTASVNFTLTVNPKK